MAHKKNFLILISVFVLIFISFNISYASKTCNEINHNNCIEIDSCGFYEYNDAYLLLTKDISNEKSCIFLSGNLILDLNGHKVEFGDANYKELNNYDFEDWGNNKLEDWDTSNAPNIKKIEKYEMPMVNEYSIFLPANNEIISDWIELPILNRYYRAFIGERRIYDNSYIKIIVEDENGNSVCSNSDKYSFGSGTAYCVFKIEKTGKYRLRIKPTKDYYLDFTGIWPMGDIGIGIIKEYSTIAGCTGDWGNCYGPDYRSINPLGEMDSITIKNGIIENLNNIYRGSGIAVSDFKNGNFNLENVTINTKGLHTYSFRSQSEGEITNSEFNNEAQWITNRENTAEVSILLGDNIIFKNNKAIGGQGVLTSGKNSLIENNYFANNQQISNHYALNTGSNSIIQNNIFEPISGSGILLGDSNNVKILNNTFYVTGEICSAEYIDQGFSTTAIRLTDYNRKPPSTKISYDNYIKNNKFYITGKYYPKYKTCTPLASGIYMSVGGGVNYIEDNYFYVENTNPNSLAFPFYIGSSDQGGHYKNNQIYSNTAFAWISSWYGKSGNILFENNTFNEIKDSSNQKDNVCGGFADFWVGYCCGFNANNITFIDNIYNLISDKKTCFRSSSSYKDKYDFHYKTYIDVKVIDENGDYIQNANIKINNSLYNKNIKINGKTTILLDTSKQNGYIAGIQTTKNIVNLSDYDFEVSANTYFTKKIKINSYQNKSIEIILIKNLDIQDEINDSQINTSQDNKDEINDNNDDEINDENDNKEDEDEDDDEIKSTTKIDYCVEDWECSEWTECIGEKKNRDCKDLNNCGTKTDKPRTYLYCSVDENGNEVILSNYDDDLENTSLNSIQYNNSTLNSNEEEIKEKQNYNFNYYYLIPILLVIFLTSFYKYKQLKIKYLFDYLLEHENLNNFLAKYEKKKDKTEYKYYLRKINKIKSKIKNKKITNVEELEEEIKKISKLL